MMTLFYFLNLHRSEERRVGKECRYRCWRYQAEDGIRDGHVTGVQTCALPIYASKGLYLKGDGAGRFTPVRLTASGFHVLGDAKSLTELRGADNKKLILSARNDDTLLLFESSQIGRASCRERV